MNDIAANCRGDWRRYSIGHVAAMCRSSDLRDRDRAGASDGSGEPFLFLSQQCLAEPPSHSLVERRGCTPAGRHAGSRPDGVGGRHRVLRALLQTQPDLRRGADRDQRGAANRRGKDQPRRVTDRERREDDPRAADADLPETLVAGARSNEPRVDCGSPTVGGSPRRGAQPGHDTRLRCDHA
jgi:hypothetical protein